MTISGSGSSDFLEEGILNHIFRGILFSSCPIWLALFAPPTTASGLETNDPDINELSGGNYERVSASTTDILPAPPEDDDFEPPIVVDTGFLNLPQRSWTVENGGAYNNHAIGFPKASSDWGEINYIAIMSGSHNSSGSKIYFYSKLTGASTVDANRKYYIIPGGLTITITGDAQHYLGNLILNHILNRIYFKPTGLSTYLALYNILPNDASNIVGREVSGSVGYVRKLISASGQTAIQQGAFGISAPTAGSTTSGSIIFVERATEQWGEIEGLGIIDSTSENPDVDPLGVLYTKTFLFSPFMDIGDGFYIPSGSLAIFFDDDDI